MHKSLHSTEYQILLVMLRRFRQRRRLRQSDLAERIDRDQALVSKVERGDRRLDVIELRDWLSAMEVDFLVFMAELDERIRHSPLVATTSMSREPGQDD
jgi:transcriptional regulator with XRE-family HTH domain